MFYIFTPTDQVTEKDMRDLPALMILLGDFNVHNPLWGSEKMSTGWRMMEKILDGYNLMCINKKKRNLLQSI